ncbi:MAG TPA: TonB-dependent receptor [Bacteroidales bacterium]|nr:TonB-dependent receptor [Bacteroidales bacterium]
MIKFPAVLFTAIFLIIITSSLFAQNETVSTYVTDEIVISADGYGKPLTSTTGGIGILTSDAVMKTGPVSISDALQGLTGVYKSSDSGWGSEISIRGTGRDKVIMLIDGSRMNTSTDIGAQFGTLNPASVMRVEVLKGPISSLYGSGSVGGVVNIYTRTGEFPEEAGFKSGLNISYQDNSSGKNAYGFTSYNSESFYIFGSGSYRTHDDYSDGDGDKVNDSGFNDAEGAVNIGFKPVPGHTIELRSQYYEGWDIGIPGARDSVPLTASGAEYKKIKRALGSADYKLNPGSPVWIESKLHIYWMYLKREVCIKNAPLKIEPESDNRTTGVQWTNTFIWENNRLVAGADSWFRTIATDRTRTSMTTGALVIDDTPIPDAYYLSTGVFAEDDIKIADLTLNFGGRFDGIFTGNDKVYKSEYPVSSVIIWEEKDVRDYSWNGHTGANYQFFKGFTTGVLAASGYRAASLEERYKYIALGGGVEKWGDPDLKPERSWFFEYSLHYKNKWIKSNASSYLNQLRDLIAEEKVSSTEYRLENIDKARIWGAEYDIAVNPFDWIELYNNLSYIRGRDTKNKEDLPSIAPLRAVTGAKIKVPYGISVFADGTWTSSQKRVPDNISESESWFRLDAGADVNINSLGCEHKLYIICKNLLDKEYYDYLSLSKTGYVFNEPGRSVKCGYSVLF